ncbi:MAG: putative aminoglycoside phosphotransferase [Acidimicrobiales bacterium]|nr:putative aminoglycoside phosphotransferase [Acidimicrobiales bacterium]
MAHRLENWLGRVADASEVEVTGIEAPGESGFSSETMLVDARITAGDGLQDRHLVIRTEPTGETVFPSYDLGLQYRVMDSVARHSDVPIAPLLWFEPDRSTLGRPFFVMERVEGEVPPDNIPYSMQGFVLDASPAEQSRLQLSGIDVLADLHAIDLDTAGLKIVDQPEFGPTGLRQQLGYYDHYLHWATQGRPQPTLERARSWLGANLPDEPPPVLNWGDSRIGNIIYRDFQPVAVLDWEMVTLGPPEVDLAWYCMMHRFFTRNLGVPELPGFVSEEEVIHHYEKRSRHTVTDFGWYLLWGALRYGVIFLRIVKQREDDPDFAFTERDNPVIDLIDGLLDEVGA